MSNSYKEYASKEYVTDFCEAKHKSAIITLPVASWSNLTQTVSLNGVPDESSGDVIISPALASQEAYIYAEVYCSAQAENSLTFTCKTLPTTDLIVNVRIMGG